MPDSPASAPTVLVVGAVTTASDRGLLADLAAARAAGFAPLAVCTQLTAASRGLVTDVTDVPSDTVRAQLEHIAALGAPSAMKIGVLGSAETARAVLDAAAALDGPVLLDFVASGPSGETVLSADGIDAVAERLAVPDLVMISRQDAELVAGGAVESLDDAQVAAQRMAARGARAVVIRCGDLPYRFYDPADDPGAHSDATTGAERLSFDLYYDGEDFALFEAPLLEVAPPGLSSVFALTALRAMVDGEPLEAGLQRAKRAATDAARFATSAAPFGPRPAYAAMLSTGSS